jgi:two-component system, LuxR family, sensor histidine kinase DctS
LVRNAREAMADRAVGERLVTLAAAVGADNMIVVSVSDRGHGITPELAQNLFSPFTTTKSDGMGMGLSICRSIIEYHEGQMRFQPNVPQGAIFEFTLPIAENA